MAFFAIAAMVQLRSIWFTFNQNQICDSSFLIPVDNRSTLVEQKIKKCQ
jgi:hypothetical protein